MHLNSTCSSEHLLSVTGQPASVDHQPLRVKLQPRSINRDTARILYSTNYNSWPRMGSEDRHTPLGPTTLPRRWVGGWCTLIGHHDRCGKAPNDGQGDWARENELAYHGASRDRPMSSVL